MKRDAPAEQGEFDLGGVRWPRPFRIRRLGHFGVNVADPEASRGAVAEKIAAGTSEEWRARFAGRDVCCAIVASVEEALADPHFAARGLFSRNTLTTSARR